eukprot:2499832-Prymnesium_polylepis.1
MATRAVMGVAMAARLDPGLKPRQIVALHWRQIPLLGAPSKRPGQLECAARGDRVCPGAPPGAARRRARLQW